MNKAWMEWGIVTLMFGMFCALYWVFMTAYASPFKMTRVWIDLFGEANFEWWLMNCLLVLFFGFVVFKFVVFKRGLK